jgi:N-glycosylase/DNA lyase
VDENYSELYKLVQTHPETKWIAKKRAGRLLRCASLWEDIVKMLCTTNCTWHLTKLMIINLIQKAGDGKTFPLPEQIARYDENFLRNEVKMGYRSPYLFGMAKDITERRIDLQNWVNWTGTTADLYKEMRKVKGLGEYAVSNLLKLLGRYDYLGIDSWGRRKFAELYHQGTMVPDKQIISFYNRFGIWSGLIFWLDLTRDIYDSIDK